MDANPPSTTEDSGRPLTWKGFAAGLALWFVVSSGWNTFLNQGFAPSILREVDRLITERIDAHSVRSHVSSVSREELKLVVLDRLNLLATKDQVANLVDRISRIESRLSEIEKKNE